MTTLTTVFTTVIAKNITNEISPVADQTTLAKAEKGTVQIWVYAEMDDVEDEGGIDGFKSLKLRTGLGTLVANDDGELFILTHDHWRDLGAVITAQILDVNGALIAEVDGHTFRGWVLYRDGGSLLLGPLRLLANSALEPVEVGSQDMVSPGIVVTIARQVSGNPGQVEFIQSEMVSTGQVQGVPTYNLHSLGGEAIVQGDSGGGVWYNGKLVGNTWKGEFYMLLRWNALKSGRLAEQASVAAQLPDGIWDVLTGAGEENWGEQLDQKHVLPSPLEF
jgi:hypothetical protein